MSHLSLAFNINSLPAALLLTQCAFAQYPNSTQPETPSSFPQELGVEHLNHPSSLDMQNLVAKKLDAETEKIYAERYELMGGAAKKREAEIRKLEAETQAIQPKWGAIIATFFGTVVGFVGIGVTGWLAWRQALKERISTFDMKLFEARLANYHDMVAATEALALYSPYLKIDQCICSDSAKKLTKAYYSLTGLLLTNTSQQRYVSLISALLRAASAPTLNVPRSATQWAAFWDRKNLEAARGELGLKTSRSIDEDIDPIDRHVFGDPQAPVDADFIVLQFAASQFRTALTEDIASRKPIESVNGSSYVPARYSPTKSVTSS